MPNIYTDGLETERLYTRFLTPGDEALWLPFLQDEESIRFLPNPELLDPEERSRQWVERQLTRYRENIYGLQWLIDKKTDEIVGQCGLLLHTVDGIPETEIGYHLFKPHRGKGFATEAARRFRDFAFENGQADSLISIIHVNNMPSQRVASQNEMTQGPQTDWLGLDVFIYRIHRHEWEKRR